MNTLRYKTSQVSSIHDYPHLIVVTIAQSNKTSSSCWVAEILLLLNVWLD